MMKSVFPSVVLSCVVLPLCGQRPDTRLADLRYANRCGAIAGSDPGPAGRQAGGGTCRGSPVGARTLRRDDQPGAATEQHDAGARLRLAPAPGRLRPGRGLSLDRLRRLPDHHYPGRDRTCRQCLAGRFLGLAGVGQQARQPDLRQADGRPCFFQHDGHQRQAELQFRTAHGGRRRLQQGPRRL